jgi:ABC-type transport system involved in multi-copper enzyme maturation permease subunit
MTNIIRSDIFRLRKGAAVKFTLFGVCAFLAAMALIMLLLASGVFTGILESSSEFAMFNSNETWRSQVDDLYTAMNEAPQNGAEFVRVFVSAGLLPFFLLPLMLAVFAADYTAGTYRNTLSYETRRGKVYWAKLLTSILAFVLLFAVSLVFAALIGSLLFGFGGLSFEYIGWLLMTILLQLPIYLGMICFIHFLIAFTQKSSTTIAVFLLVLLLFPSVVQLLTFLLPTFGWLANFDLLGGLGAVAGYATASPGSIILPVTLGAVLAIASTSAGIFRYVKVDLV